MLLLRDADLIQHFKREGTPLPFPLSSLRKDRYDGFLGGIPYRKPGHAVLYNPGEVMHWLEKLPVHRGGRGQVASLKMGRPSNEEKEQAKKLGISIPDLRTRELGKKMNSSVSSKLIAGEKVQSGLFSFCGEVSK